MGFSPINHPFGGTQILGNLQIEASSMIVARTVGHGLLVMSWTRLLACPRRLGQVSPYMTILETSGI